MGAQLVHRWPVGKKVEWPEEAAGVKWQLLGTIVHHLCTIRCAPIEHHRAQLVHTRAQLCVRQFPRREPGVRPCSFFFSDTEIHHRSTRSHAAKLNREKQAR